MIELPFLTQNGNGVLNDCGPADALMLARWVGKGMTATVAQVAGAIGRLNKLTSADDVAAALRWLGCTPTRGLAAQYPFIQLVPYQSLPYKAPGFTAYTGDHWIPRTGPSTYHDPLFLDAKGANLPTSADLLDRIDKNPALRIGLSNEPPSWSIPFQGTVKKISWNVRATPSAVGTILDVVKQGSAVKFLYRTRGNNYEFGALQRGAGGAVTWDPIDEAKPSLGFARLDGFTLREDVPVPPPTPPPVASPIRLGFNSVSTMKDVQTAFGQGCRFAIILNDFLFASQLKKAYPDADVLVRRVELPGGIPTVDQAIQALEGAGDPNLIYTYFNENDQIGCNPDQIRARGAFEVKLAQAIKARNGAKFLAGGYSMGTPDFTSADVRTAIRETYAAPYNAGVIGWHSHNYSPKPGHIYGDVDLQYYEMNYRRLFTECGFDPSRRAVYFSETGLDEGGVGGYAGHQMNPDQVIAELTRWRQIHGANIVVNGVSYLSPVVGGAIFCLGDFGKWGGYNMLSFLPRMGPLYQ